MLRTHLWLRPETPWELLEVLHLGINFVFIVPSSFESSIQKNGARKSNVSRITLYYSFKIFEITFQNTSFFIKRDGFFPLQASQLFTRQTQPFYHCCYLWSYSFYLLGPFLRWRGRNIYCRRSSMGEGWVRDLSAGDDKSGIPMTSKIMRNCRNVKWNLKDTSRL